MLSLSSGQPLHKLLLLLFKLILGLDTRLVRIGLPEGSLATGKGPNGASDGELGERAINLATVRRVATRIAELATVLAEGWLIDVVAGFEHLAGQDLFALRLS